MSEPEPTARQLTDEDLPPEQPLHSDGILLARAVANQRRAAAMVADYDRVGGMILNPITPASWSRLVALRSPFTWDGDAEASDVRNYVWFHSPRFTIDPGSAAAAQARVYKEFDARVAFGRQLWLCTPKRRRSWVLSGYELAKAQIATIVEETFADSQPQASTSPRIAASLEASMIDLFARQYATWPFPTPIRDTPLRKLYQLLRCINGGDYEKTEADIIAEELRADNEALAAKKGAN